MTSELKIIWLFYEKIILPAVGKVRKTEMFRELVWMVNHFKFSFSPYIQIWHCVYLISKVPLYVCSI